MSAALNEKFLPKPEERFESSKIREKLKANCTHAVKKVNGESKRGPLIVKHMSTLHLNPEPNYKEQTLPRNSRICRTPSPTPSKGSLDSWHGVRCRPHSPRRRSPNAPRSRPSSPNSSTGSRGVSPAGSVDNLHVELVKKRVKKVQRARLYLLQQPGPHSFLVAGDSPDHKFKVIIGPQSCSCNSGPPCIHLLFVMLRVFQIPENDPCLWSKTLKNFEVEALFSHYEEQRRMRTKDARKNLESTCSSGTSCASGCKAEDESNSEHVGGNNCQDEELCPICLLEMVDGESLVHCMKGCHNKLHHHCIAIWANECSRMNEPILCPLCRAEWSSVSEDISCSKIRPPNKCPTCLQQQLPTNHRDEINNNVSSSSLHNISQVKRERELPPAASVHSEPILTSPSSSRHSQPSSAAITLKSVVACLRTQGVLPESTPRAVSPSKPAIATQETYASVVSVDDQKCLVQQWTQVFGLDLVSCLRSRLWIVRETALRRLSCELISRLGNDQWVLKSPSSVSPVVEQTCSILTEIATDPVYKVYLASLKCLRTLLTCFSSKYDGNVTTMGDMLKPVMQSILLRCAGATKRFSKLSIEILIEMCKGQNGGLGLGIRTSYPDKDGFGGIDYILNCVFDNHSQLAMSWQGWLGRLYLLEKLMQEFPKEFTIPYNPITSEIQQTDQYSRLTSVLNFTTGAMQSTHVAVSRHAQKVYLVGAELTKRVHTVFAHVCDMVSSIDVSLYQRLKKKLWATLREGHASATSWSQGWNRSFILPDKCDVTRWPDFLASWDELNWTKQCNKSSARRLSFQGGPNSQGTISSSTNSVSSWDFKPRHNQTSTLKKPVANKRPNQLSLSTVSGNQGHHLAPSSPMKARGHHSEPSTPNGKARKNFGCNKPLNEQIKSFDDSGGSSPSIASKKRTEVNWPTIKHRRDSGISSWTEALEEENNRRSQKNELRLNLKQLPKYPSAAVQKNTCIELTAFKKEITTPCTPVAPCSSPVTDIILPRNSVTALSCLDQSDLPFIPGLMDVWHDEHGMVFEREDSICTEGSDSPQYVEDVHWIRGHILGTGAFSNCYQARDVQTGTIMAIKQVLFCRNSPEEQDKVMAGIKDEISMMSRLEHPNIVRILGATQQQNQINMFVEWMPGGSVAGLLEKYGPFTDHVIVNYTQQVLSGLAYLHDNQILHRDLKGANLLVDSTGHHLRIGDFGAAASLISHATIEGEFQGQLLGTIAFMAPEVLRGEDYGRSCDIWSVGCVMIEMATTKPPWNAPDVSNHLALMYKIASSTKPPPIPANLTDLTRDLALHCLELKSEDRLTAKELLNHSCFCLLKPG